MKNIFISLISLCFLLNESISICVTLSFTFSLFFTFSRSLSPSLCPPSLLISSTPPHPLSPYIINFPLFFNW